MMIVKEKPTDTEQNLQKHEKEKWKSKLEERKKKRK